MFDFFCCVNGSVNNLISKYSILEKMALLRVHQYSRSGHPTGEKFLADFREILERRDLPFRCDKHTEALGNCGPYAIMQQLHRPELQSTLSEEIKILSQNCHTLRSSIVDFIRNMRPSSEYFGIVHEARFNHTLAGKKIQFIVGTKNWK